MSEKIHPMNVLSIKSIAFFIIGCGIVASITSCGVTQEQARLKAEAAAQPRWFLHEERIAAATPKKTSIDISLTSLTAQLVGADGEALAEMDVSPGVVGHETPAGKFFVREKLPLKKSNLYGRYVRRDTGEIVVQKAWEHQGPRPPGTVYEGIAMPWWLRLTDDGVGIHVGGFSRGQTTSHGCIRCPEPAQKVFWNLSRVGTPVRVHNGAHPSPSLLDPPAS
jgi:lipoprotein-anchoring transpeptidase ErfK/SrfK